MEHFRSTEKIEPRSTESGTGAERRRALATAVNSTFSPDFIRLVINEVMADVAI